MPSITAEVDAPLLEMRGIEKSFPGVHALADVELDLHRGEVLALLGENGAGKSTLIKMLGGAHQPDHGSIRLEGRDAELRSPAAAIAAGIGVIYQEFNLVPDLTACENIFLGKEKNRVFVQRGGERRRALDLFRQIGVEIPLDVPCRRLSTAQQQIVEIVKALAQDARLIVMDEPTASLSPHEADHLFSVIRDLRRHGMGVIYISHRLDEVFAIADRVVVLRDGQRVGQGAVGNLDRQQIIELMVGRQIENEFPDRSHAVGEPRLVIRELRGADATPGVSLTVRRGEVLGITGLVGAGRTELARLIFGADRATSGKVKLDGHDCKIGNPRQAIAAGICLLTEDRKSQGLVTEASVVDNFALPNLAEFSRNYFVLGRNLQRAFARFVEALKIKIANPQQLACNLSGGNQQKIVLAKWLQRNAEVVMFDEPTRGIDVGAKYEIYTLINKLAAQGKAILMISSELPEVLGMCDRILVMHNGRVVGEVGDPSSATQQQLMELAVG